VFALRGGAGNRHSYNDPVHYIEGATKMKVLFVWPNKDSFNYKPINIPLLSAIAKKAGWESRLYHTSEIDFGFNIYTKSKEEAKIFKPVNFDNLNLEKQDIDLESHFIKAVEAFSPDLLAFSVLSEEHVIAEKISKISKSKFPDIPIIWGGKCPTLKPEKTMQQNDIDFICVGEGLEAFEEFLDGMEGKRDIYNIRNIWANKNGSIIKNTIRPLIKNLDQLPYVDWDIYDKRFFYKPFDGKIYIGGDHMFNWGCPYHCTYCINDYLHKMYDNKYFMRRYSTERIISELKFLTNKFDIEFYKFHDEDFLMRPLENLKELSVAYKKEVNIPFAIETNPHTITEEKVKLLKEMNCVSVGAAIETGDLELRKKLLRRVDSEKDIIRAFRLLNEAGIRNSSFNILGIPHETRETYKKSIEINRSAGVQVPNILFFFPFEGTELREIAIKEGFFDPTDDTYVFNYDEPHLHFDSLTEEELIQMRLVFVLYVKLPEKFFPYIRRSEKVDELGSKLREKLLSIFDKTVFENNGFFVEEGNSDRCIDELNFIVDEFGEKIDFEMGLNEI